MMDGISKIRRVPLREVWRHEAYDLTQWMEQNVDVLNDALDIDLVSAEREQAAGPFSIDLVAEDSSGDSYVIENQLEKSDHDHLGKLITYFTSMDAKAGIWIVSEPRPEHVAAMAWLNEATNANFYLVKIEAIKIEDSPAAPLLTLIVGPSAEAKEVGRVKREQSEQDERRQSWWTMLVGRPDAKLHAHITPTSNNWLALSTGFRGLSLNYVMTKTDCGAELYIDRARDGEGAPENKRIFDELMSCRGDIDPKVSRPIDWQRLEGRRACRLRVTVPGGYAASEDQWPAIQAELVQAMNELEAALRPVLPRLQAISR